MRHIRTIVVLKENFPEDFEREITDDELDEHAELVCRTITNRMSNAFHYEIEAITTIEEE